jgi:hypothetical protein
MTRPLDLYFKNHNNQVWAATRNQSRRDTSMAAGRHYFGSASSPGLGEYLDVWWSDAPIFGRVTTDHFFRGNEFIAEPKEAINGCQRRLKMLQQVDRSRMTTEQQERLAHFEALEQLLISFCQVQELSYRPAVKAFQSGDFGRARALLQSGDPADTIRQFSKLSQMAGGDRGEEAMVLSLGTRWITDFVAARQAAGLEPIRIDFGPTVFEPLAQGAGSYTFFIDSDGQYWSVRGERETRRQVMVLGKGEPTHLRGYLPEAVRPIAQAGLVLDGTTTLAISPIVNLFSKLAPGDYHLTLYLGALDEPSVIDISTGGGSTSPAQYQFKPQRGKHLRLQCRGNNENQWNSIHELRCAALGSPDATIASAAVEGHGAELAVDGDAATRWAAEGREQWIQLALDPEKTFDRLEIEWYEGASRRYDFGIAVSNDGREWTKVDYEIAGKSTDKDRIDLSQRGGGKNTVIALEYPVKLQRAGAVRVTLSPVTGKTLVCGATLSPAKRE